MITYDPDDLPGVVSWWPEAAEVISRQKRDFKSRFLDGRYKTQHNACSKRYYEKNKEQINAKRREAYKTNKKALEYYYAHREEIRAKSAARTKARRLARQSSV